MNLSAVSLVCEVVIIINTVFAGGPVPDDAEPLLFIEWINSMYFYICV